MTLLSVEGIDVFYGPVQVMYDVSFEAGPHEMVALLGVNGAGKSTLLRTISGVIKPAKGRIVFDGKDITGASPARVVQEGIVQVPGGRATFPGLTVLENLVIGAWSLRRDKRERASRIEQVLELFPRLDERKTQLAGTMSGGEQQMLALARAFLARPRLLMIDELSLGLAPAIVKQLVRILLDIHAQGTPMIVVEQNATLAMKMTHRAYFLEKGEVRFEGPSKELRERTDLLRAVFLTGARGVRGGSRRSTEEDAALPTAADPPSGQAIG